MAARHGWRTGSGSRAGADADVAILLKRVVVVVVVELGTRTVAIGDRSDVGVIVGSGPRIDLGAVGPPDCDHHILRDARKLLTDPIVVERMTVDVVQQHSLASQGIGMASAVDMLLCSGTIVDVPLSLGGVLVLPVVEVAGYPLALEEVGRSCFEQRADDFPQFSVRTLFKFLLRVVQDEVENVDDRKTVAHYAGGHARSAHDI